MSLPASGAAPADAGTAGRHLATAVTARREELLEILGEIATFDSAVEELDCTVQVLCGAAGEIERYAPSSRATAVFLPSNNLLYSYALYGLVPAMFSRDVWIRPAARYSGVAVRLHAALREAAAVLPGRIDVRSVSQRAFVEQCRAAEVVVFAGQHANGIAVASQLREETRVLLFGSGPNPMVIGPEASLAEVVPAALRSRLHNVGQDCLCSDLYFVHADRSGEFVEALCDSLATLRPGDRRAPETVLAPLVYPDVAARAQQFVGEHRELVVRPGNLSDPAGPQPVVMVAQRWRDLHPPEFFAPVFLVVAYEEVGQVRTWLGSARERARGMYLPVFGEPGLPSSGVVETSVVCGGRTSFDFEDGNEPFGGYGPEASSVSHRAVIAGRPLLLSAEMARGHR